MNFARSLASEDGRVSYEGIGTSSEGREIGLIKISSGGNGNKPAIWIDGGMVRAMRHVPPLFGAISLLYSMLESGFHPPQPPTLCTNS